MPTQLEIDQHYMDIALGLAREAAAMGEIPVGALVVQGSADAARILGQGFNRRERNCDASAHAEIVAMRAAGVALRQWRLLDCTLYVTLEPCPMCAGAAVNARIARVVFGCTDPKAGAMGTLYEIGTDGRLNHRLETVRGVRAEGAAELLREFFRSRR